MVLTAHGKHVNRGIAIHKQHLLPPPFSLSCSYVQSQVVHKTAYKIHRLQERRNTSAISPSSVQANYEYNVHPWVPKGKNPSPSAAKTLRELRNRCRHILA